MKSSFILEFCIPMIDSVYIVDNNMYVIFYTEINVKRSQFVGQISEHNRTNSRIKRDISGVFALFWFLRNCLRLDYPGFKLRQIIAGPEQISLSNVHCKIKFFHYKTVRLILKILLIISRWAKTSVGQKVFVEESSFEEKKERNHRQRFFWKKILTGSDPRRISRISNRSMLQRNKQTKKKKCLKNASWVACDDFVATRDVIFCHVMRCNKDICFYCGQVHFLAVHCLLLGP